MFGRNNGITAPADQYSTINPNGNEIPGVRNVDEDLFSDKGAAEKKTEENKDNTRSEITEFLESGFEKDGYNDGYDDPSVETMNTSVNKIKSDYIFLIEKKISALNQMIMNLQEDSIKISGITETDKNLIESRIAELRKLILRLFEEKEGTDLNKGSVMKAVNAYKAGFRKGVSDFTREKIIGTSTGMF
ncbi:MAG: hypothetical protein JSS91_07565 [Bacteroidetes bacterium]|nr:hypothetical protein [Bacteroidota bacterium]